MLAIALTLFFSASSFAQEPPLVPRKVFDAPAEHDFLTVSPNGKTIAYTAPSDQGVANVWVEDLSTHKKRMVTRAGHRGIDGEVAVGHAMDRVDSRGRLNDSNLDAQVREVALQLLTETGATIQASIAA